MRRLPRIRFLRDAGRAAEEEVRAELEAHFRGSVELLVARGWTEEAARAEVRRRFGDEDRYRAELERLARRRALRRRLGSALRIAADVFGAAQRDVRRHPGVSVGVAIILAVGIGVNGAVFRVIDRLLLSSPPYVDDPSRVVRLHQTVRYGTAAGRSMEAFTYGDVQALRSADATASVGAVMSGMPETLGSGEDAIRVRIARADSVYLPLLGVGIELGRPLQPSDHAAGAVPVAILGYGLWAGRFGGDPAIIGRTIRLARGEYQVVGVLPRGFGGAQAPVTDVWIPLERAAVDRWGPGWQENPSILAFRILVRLPPGTDGDDWAARMEGVLRAGRSGEQPPGELIALRTSSLAPGSGPDPGAMVSVSRWLAGVALLVLLVACANAANLLLAHGARQRRRTAVRIALGASAGLLRLELLMRSLLLALAGGALAALAASWGGGLLEALFLEGMELPTRPESGRVLFYTAGVATLSALLCGAVPVLGAHPGDVRPALQSGGRVIGGRGGIRQALVCVQMALSMLLLVGAALFVGSFRSALDVDLGFDHEELLMIRLETEAGSERASASLYDEVERRLAALPVVSSTSATVAVPFVLLYALTGGLPGEDAGEEVHVNAVGPRFFRTLGLEIVRGRAFGTGDLRDGGASVAVVSARTAARLWPGQDPLGRCLRIGDAPECVEVVGVASGHQGVSWTPGGMVGTDVMQAWVPLGHPEAAAPSALMVRTAGSPERALDSVRRAAGEAPGVRFVEAAVMSEFVAREMRSWRVGAALFSLFGGIALVVAAVGLYGVLAFDVAQRRREFGIRRALGAGRMRVVARVLASAAPMVILGMFLGGSGALVGAVRMQDLLFRISPWDVRVFVAAAGALILTAAAALSIPAWRAGGVDPREALAET